MYQARTGEGLDLSGCIDSRVSTLGGAVLPPRPVPRGLSLMGPALTTDPNCLWAALHLLLVPDCFRAAVGRRESPAAAWKWRYTNDLFIELQTWQLQACRHVACCCFLLHRLAYLEMAAFKLTQMIIYLGTSCVCVCLSAYVCVYVCNTQEYEYFFFINRRFFKFWNSMLQCVCGLVCFSLCHRWWATAEWFVHRHQEGIWKMSPKDPTTFVICRDALAVTIAITSPQSKYAVFLSSRTHKLPHILLFTSHRTR